MGRGLIELDVGVPQRGGWDEEKGGMSSQGETGKE